MNVIEMVPIIVYDNQCYVCIKFAKIIGFLSRGNLTMIGHYSDSGIKIRKILGKSALEMFWVIDKKTAYGGRAALLPLLRSIIFTLTKKSSKSNNDDKCDKECKTVKAVLIRSISLFSNSKKIELL